MNSRRSIRKKGHDYSGPGDYFVSLCTPGREPLLGEITEDRISLSPFGGFGLPNADGRRREAGWDGLGFRSFPIHSPTASRMRSNRA